MTETERAARAWLTVERGGVPLVPEPIRSTGTPDEIIAAALQVVEVRNAADGPAMREGGRRRTRSSDLRRDA